LYCIKTFFFQSDVTKLHLNAANLFICTFLLLNTHICPIGEVRTG